VARVTGQPANATDTVAANIDQSVCHACDRQEPPPRKNEQINADTIAWVGCDFCRGGGGRGSRGPDPPSLRQNDP